MRLNIEVYMLLITRTKIVSHFIILKVWRVVKTRPYFTYGKITKPKQE